MVFPSPAEINRRRPNTNVQGVISQRFVYYGPKALRYNTLLDINVSWTELWLVGDRFDDGALMGLETFVSKISVTVHETQPGGLYYEL